MIYRETMIVAMETDYIFDSLDGHVAWPVYVCFNASKLTLVIQPIAVLQA